MLKRISFCVILIMPLGFISGFTQAAIATSGSEGKGAGGFVSWSVGQVAYSSFKGKGNTGSVSQGVQQAYTISVIGFRNAMSLSYSVYPNPTTDNIILETPGFKVVKLTYQLLDMLGNIIKSDLISANRTEINTVALPSSTYFLKIIQGNNQVQSFKIIKN